MAQDIVVRYRAEVDDLLRKLDQISDAQKEVIDGEIKANNATKQAATTQAVAAQKRNQLLELEKKKLAELQKAQKLAFDPKQIEEYNRKISESQKNIDLLKGKVGGLKGIGASTFASIGAGVAAAFSVNAIINFANAAVDAFARVEAGRLIFQNLVGDVATANRLFDELQQFSVRTPFTPQQVQDAAKALLQFGVANEEVVDTVKLLGDVSAGTGKDLKELAIIFGQIKSTGRLLGQDLLQLINAGFNPLQVISEKTGKSVATLKKEMEKGNITFEQVADAFKIATSEGGKFFELTDKLADTTAGQLSTLQGQAEALSASIGQKLAPAFLRVRTAALAFLSDTIDGFRTLFNPDVLKTEQFEKDQRNTYDRILAQVEGTVNELERIGTARDEAITKSVDITKKSIEELIKAQERQISLNSPIEEQKRIDASIEALKNELSLVDEIGKTLEENRLKELERARLEAEAAELQAELDKQKKLKELRDKEKEEREKRLEEYRQKLEETEFGLTDLERDEQKKRDDAFFDSLEKRRKALQELADAEKDRAAQAQQIQFDAQIEELQGETLEVRQRFADEFKRLTLEDLETKKNAIRSELGFSEDANNQIVILEKQTNDALKKLFEELGVSWKGVTSDKVSDWIKANGEILNATAALFNEIANLTSTLGDRRIEEINRQRDAEIEAIDQALEANDIALEKRRISERQATDNEKKLLDEKVKAEETAAKKEREIKRRQAILDKAAALFQITIQTAQAIVAAKNPVLVALYASLGAAQAAVVAAQPIPYKRGSKSTKGGLSRVGEEGEEILYIPQGSKVLPNRQTNRYGEVLDAMFDNRFEDYVNQRYIAPALMKEKARRESNQQRSFAENIVQSAMVNPQTGLTYYDMEQIRKKGTRLTDDTIERLADALTRRSTNDIYRR